MPIYDTFIVGNLTNHSPKKHLHELFKDYPMTKTELSINFGYDRFSRYALVIFKNLEDIEALKQIKIHNQEGEELTFFHIQRRATIIDLEVDEPEPQVNKLNQKVGL